MGLKQVKVQLCSVWGSDKEAAHAAWASTYDQEKLEQKSEEDIRRIASNLVVHGHDTPKERIWIEVFATGPIFIERQIDKYRMTVQYQDIQVEYQVADFARLGITQNELSGRYRTIPDRPYHLPEDVTDILARMCQQQMHSQGFLDEYRRRAREVWAAELDRQHRFYQTNLTALREAEAAGAITNAEYKRAREVLRGILGTAYLTDMRLVMNLNAFEHVINQRIPGHAQVESQVFAYLLLQEVRKNEVAKVLVEAMVEKHGWQKHIDRIEALLAKEID